MPATAIDMSVIVAGLLSWHEHHQAAFQALDALLGSNDDVIVPAQVLVEAYSLMTHLPHPHRVSPRDAFALLSQSFRERVRVVAPSGRETWAFLRNVSEGGIAGGLTYDAQILRCAARAGATRILTLNARISNAAPQPAWRSSARS